MQFSWQNLKAAIAEMVTSKQLSVESGKLITDAVEADVSAKSTPASATASAVATTPPTAAPVAATEPPVAAATQPPAPAPAPVTAQSNDELAQLKAENERLKAQLNPALAAAIPASDATQNVTKNAGQSASEENPHYRRLASIKKKFTRFDLTAEIEIGEEEK